MNDDNVVKMSELSQETIFEVPRRISWRKAFMYGNCELVIPDFDGLNDDGMSCIRDSGFSDSDNDLTEYFQQNSDQLQPTASYCYLLPNLKPPIHNAQAILFNASSTCVVVNLHGESVMGLAGGGMDFSWDICTAYIRLGYLPPFHFCDLPEIESLKSDVVTEACMRTCEIVWEKGLRTFNNLLEI